MRVAVLLLLCTALLLGDTFKLYLKDGGYHVTREYQVQGDRVRYFSTERDEWEEIPVELVDLSRTEKERKAVSERREADERAQDDEEKAERAERHEIASVPQESGAYYKVGEKIETVPAADYQVITDKKRRALQMVSPVPLIPGKATVVIKGDHSNFLVTEARPSFYLRLAKEERFGIIRLTPMKKNTRIVENLSIIPAVNQAVGDRKQMETFEQQVADGLYRVWPEKPLAPGEYALIEFSESGDTDDVQLIVWDFACRPAAQ